MVQPFEQKTKDVLDYIQGLHLLPGKEKRIVLEFDDEATFSLPDAESTWKILDSLKKAGAIVILEEKRWEFLTAVKEFERMFGKKPYRCVLEVNSDAFEKYRRDFLKEGSVLFSDQGSVSKDGVEVVPITKSTIDVKLPNGTIIPFKGSRARILRYFFDQPQDWFSYSDIEQGTQLEMNRVDIKKAIREINQRIMQRSFGAYSSLIAEKTDPGAGRTSERQFRWYPSC